VTLYRDTRGLVDRPRTFTEALLDGMAPGGGLYVPEELPSLSAADLARLATLPYAGRAAAVYEAFGLDVAAARIAEIATLAYGDNFDDPEVAPVRDLGDGRFVLELWHGPTLAFKDMALQCMPLFFSEALELAHARGATDLDFLILVATSGDTGVAALNGFADRAHTKIAVSYPDAGVSAIQERQMTTQPGGNLTVFAVEGDFDACQSAVKAVFDDGAFAADLAARFGLAMSSANSINWGRLLPQIVYYVSAYADMAARGHVASGAPIDVCVPTGNFGDILAGYYAKRMGVPIRRLLCASNTNKVLADFIATGTYDISGRDLVKTPSPSMDILISNNLERLLLDLRGDPAVIRGWMDELRTARRFTVDGETLAKLQDEFVGAWVDNDTCLRTIGEVQREKGYLMDPHTAVAWRMTEELRGGGAGAGADPGAGPEAGGASERVPVLIVSTAHWSKFAADVVRGLSGVPDGAPLDEPDDFALLDRVVELAPGARVPASLEAVRARPTRFDTRIAGRRNDLERSLLGWLAGE
jgi:threonine synthase